MRAVYRDRFTVWQTPHEVPIDFGVPEGRPPMVEGLFNEISPRAVPWCIKERFTGVRIVESQLARSFTLFFQERRCFPVTRVLRVMPAGKQIPFDECMVYSQKML